MIVPKTPDYVVIASWPITRRALWRPCFVHTLMPQRPPDPWLGGWVCGCEAWNDEVSSPANDQDQHSGGSK